MTALPSGRIVFAGSPDFAVPALERLVGTGHAPCAVLTQPDRPAGRGRELQMSPVKRCALAHDLPVLQPASLRADAGARAVLRDLAPDLIVVVAYGLIFPPEVLALPRQGCINLHASLLPRWRGAAPIQAALLAGDARTGISLMRLEAGLDTGPVAARREIPIGRRETAGELHDRLASLGADLLADTLAAVLGGTAVYVPQPSTGITYAGKFGKADARIDWREPAVTIERRIRAYNPWPVAETQLEGRQLRCWLGEVCTDAGSGSVPGRVLAAGPQGIDVETGAGILRLTSVQAAGRQRMDAGAFARGTNLPGRVLGA